MSGNLIMLPIRQKQIVDTIKKGGFKQKDFDFIPLSNEDFNIIYKAFPEYKYIKSEKINQLYSMTPAPGGRIIMGDQTRGFGQRIVSLGTWLKALKENIEIGNPWEEIRSFQNDMNEIRFDSYEEMFSKDERIKIDQKLNLLLDHIRTLEIETSQIQEDVKHLKSMAGTISKKDWILLLLGCITGWIFTNMITPEQTQLIWEYIKVLFSGFKLKFLQ